MDFSLILFIGLVVTGSILLLSRLRKQDGPDNSLQTVRGKGVSIVAEYARAFFPVILIVFLLRSFIVEPFRIPSGSMLPTLFVGDFILVDKFRYGIRLPIVNFKILRIASPERGEVMVFRYPHDNKTNFIKRVVGIPGDEIIYVNKKLFINGEAVEQALSDSYTLNHSNDKRLVTEFNEGIGDAKYSVLNDSDRPARALKISVPENSYFVMGDNRDHSNDSRYWGFVPDENIVGRAFLVWFSWARENGGVNWSRIGYNIP